MSDNRMHAETFAVLRHIEVHGPRNKTELTKGLQQATADVSKRVANLLMLGYLVLDASTTPAAFALTGKARHKLADPYNTIPRTPRTMPKRAVEAPSSAMSVAQVSRVVPRAAPVKEYVRTARDSSMSMNPRYYRADEIHDSTRPGAMQAFTLPSRVGDQLRYRDGTVTDLDGNALS